MLEDHTSTLISVLFLTRKRKLMQNANIVPARMYIAKVAVAATIGSWVENYDFLISGTAAAIIWPTVFFPQTNEAIGLLLSVTIFALSFVVRPIAAFIFGHIGDRYGRRSTLFWTLLTMGLGTLAIAVTPSYAQIGVLGGVLLAIFRIVQGLGFGGEWQGAATWVAETAAKSKSRGFWSGWVSQMSPLGAISANLAFTLTIASMDHQSFVNWGWRIPFYVGVLVIVAGIIVRLRLEESSVFKAIKERNRIARVPSLEVLKKMPKTIALVGIAASYVGGAGFTVYVFSLAYLNALKAPSYIGTLSIIIGGVVGMFVILFTSILSDRIGRLKIIMISQALTVLFVAPYFMLMNTLNPVFITVAQIAMLALVFSAFSVFPAYFTEIFPAEFRYSGSGLVYQFYNLIGGGFVPIISSYLLFAFGGPLLAWPYVAGLIALYSIAGLVASLASRHLRTDFMQIS